MKFAFKLLQAFVLGTTKLSAILFYRRIFRGKAFDHYSKGMIVVVSAWWMSFFNFLFECGVHLEYSWSTLLNLVTHCANEEIFFRAYAVSDVIIDGLILAMLIPIVCFHQTEIVLALMESTNGFTYGDCRCHISANWLCALYSYWAQCESYHPLPTCLDRVVVPRNLPPRAVAAGLARVVIVQSQLASRYRFLLLLNFGSLSH